MEHGTPLGPASGKGCVLIYVQVKYKYKLMHFCRFLYIDRQFVHHAAWTTNMSMQNQN
jgi:hypothetical protein